MRKIIAVCVVLGAAVPSRAMPCSMVLAPMRLGRVVEFSDLVLVAAARTGCSRHEQGCSGRVTLDVHRTLKGRAATPLEVIARCDTIACEFACFEEGETYVFFLVVDASGVVQVMGAPLPVDDEDVVHVRPWWWDSDLPAELALDRFERLVRDPTVDKRELPLTLRFRGEHWQRLWRARIQ